MDKQPSSRAQDIIQGSRTSSEEVFQLVRKLRASNELTLARRLLDSQRTDSEIQSDANRKRNFDLQRALCTYMDPSLSVEVRLQRALRILEQLDPMNESNDQEVLGLRGAIYKRRWETRGLHEDLELALASYRRGYEQGLHMDYGYCGINTAYLLDVLADRDRLGDRTKRDTARLIRGKIVAQLPLLMAAPDNNWLLKTYWFLVTVAEAYFGLGQNREAQEWLKRAKALADVPDLQWESVIRQFLRIAKLNGTFARRERRASDPSVERVLQELLGNAAAMPSHLLTGKLGLALSGGGFRAAFYHIGVLAKLAEVDLLRSIEVISAVSGGAILATHYFLALRRLLSAEPDEAITREDYVHIVEEMMDSFLAGVQTNIRTRVFSALFTSLKMIGSPQFSAALELGEQFEKHLFSRVPDGNGDKPRWMSDLVILPRGETRNGRRRAKIPLLVLNATALNTGKHWQLTPEWLGESPMDEDTDSDDELPFGPHMTYYAELPDGPLRLGYGVAASACVPGLFGPVPLRLKNKDIVRLVDGGVYDNQGATVLTDYGCSVVLLSDGSGQLFEEATGLSGLIGSAMRSSNVQMALLRRATLKALHLLRDSRVVDGLLLVHLRKGIELYTAKPGTALERPLTHYGILKEVQWHLARIRTDLDSFSEAEAYALMVSGYRMTEDELRGPSLVGGVAGENKPHQWKFLDIEPAMKSQNTESYGQLMRILKAAHYRLGKVVALSLALRYTAMAFAGSVIAALGYLMWTGRDSVIVSLNLVSFSIVVGVVAFAGWYLSRRGHLENVAIGLVVGMLGPIFGRIHLAFFDKWYLRLGSLREVMGRK